MLSDTPFMKELKELNKFINAFAQKLHFLSGIAIVFMTIIMTLDVVARYALNTGISDTMEISSMLLGAVTALALASVTGRGDHIRFSVLTDMFPSRGQRLAKVVTLMIAVVMFGLMTWQATIRAIGNMGTGEWVGSLQIPIWPIRMLFACCCLLTFIVLVSQLLAHFTHKADTEDI